MIEVTEQTFNESVKRLAGSDDGRIVLAWLKEFCFHNGTPLVRGNLEDTYANAAVQNVYRALRAFVKPEDLRKIEYDYVIKKTNIVTQPKGNKENVNRASARRKSTSAT